MSTSVLYIFLVYYFFQDDFSQTHAELYPRLTYGTEWVAFLDRHNQPHYVNMSQTEAEIVGDEHITSILKEGGNVRFYLYTKQNPEKPEKLAFPDYNLTYFDPDAPIYVLVHGWLHDSKSEFPDSVRKTILRKWKKNINIIIMDWYDMQSYTYVTAAERTKEASRLLRYTVEDLAEKFKIQGSSIHMVGHCLGAHVAGRAGSQMKRLNFILSRITALDPARPYFEYPARYPGISKDSAAFVDVIHTSINVLGMTQPVGHADFYPNGGELQPACCPEPTPGLPGACEHRCAYIYYDKSFDKHFEGVKCDSYSHYNDRVCDMDEIQNMGEPTLDWAHGLYFLDVLNYNKK